MKRLLLSAAIAGVAIVVLTRLGHGVLAAPPLGSLDALTQWLADRDAATAAFACVRLGGLAAAWYLLAVTMLAACARVSGSVRLGRLVDRVAHPAVRRLLLTASGAGLLSTALVVPTPASAALAEPAPPPDTAVMVLLDEGEPTTSEPTTSEPTTSEPTTSDPTTTMTLLEDEPAPEPQPAAGDAPDIAPPHAKTYVVEPGDCFWSIAEATLAEAWGRSPTDREVIGYWRTLIEANRERLADRDNADLLYPGQTLELSPVSEQPSEAME